MTVSLVLSDVEVARGTVAIRGTAEFAPGVHLLVGSSGAGKSTLLDAIGGLLPLREGTLSLGDETWNRGSEITLLPDLRRVGYVMQGLFLFPHLSVMANVAYPLRGLCGAEKTSRAHELLRRVQADRLAQRRARALSGGEAQRVALARALAVGPRVLLLDEPFSGADAPLRGALTALVTSVVRELEVPTLIATHDPERDALDARSLLRIVGSSFLQTEYNTAAR